MPSYLGSVLFVLMIAKNESMMNAEVWRLDVQDAMIEERCGSFWMEDLGFVVLSHWLNLLIDIYESFPLWYNSFTSLYIPIPVYLIWKSCPYFVRGKGYVSRFSDPPYLYEQNFVSC